jgi:outer membrane lipoprotein-sorting protein
LKVRIAILVLTQFFGAVSFIGAQADYLKEAETKARELLKKSIEALGGEAYLKVQDIQRTGKFYQFSKDNLRGAVPFQSFDKFPLKQRFEMGKKGELVNINDGDQGWKVEYKVVKTQSPEEIALYKAGLKHSLDHILRERIHEPGMKFRYLGKSRMDLGEVECVQLIDKDNDRVKIYINASNFLPAKMEFKAPGFGKRWPSDDERLMYNYHEIQNVQIPFSTVRFSNGYKVSEFHLSEVKLNQGLPDALFTPDYKHK